MCKIPDCISVHFSVNSDPVVSHNVLVHVEVDKKCTHDSSNGDEKTSILHKRQLRGMLLISYAFTTKYKPILNIAINMKEFQGPPTIM